MTVQPIDRTIGEVAEHAMLWRRENRVQLALLLGISTKTLGRRISGLIPWEAGEIRLMAEHYGLPVSVFYDGPDKLMGGDSSSRYFRQAPAAVAA